MPDDDFDIYGEDDENYNEEIAAEVRRMLQQFRNMLKFVLHWQLGDDYPVIEGGESAVASIQTLTEPVTGEKRSRESEDNSNYQDGDVQNNELVVETSEENLEMVEDEQISHIPDMLGNTVGGHGVINGSQAMNGSSANSGSSTGLDALYIGDLQWVRSSSSVTQIAEL